MSGVYVSIPVWAEGMAHSEGDVISFTRYFQQELICRGIDMSLCPFTSDIIFFLPTWEDYGCCREEYEYFKRVHNKYFAFSIPQIEQFYKNIKKG